MCWRSSPDRARPMVRLKRSTAGLNICAGLLWGSVTSPTTSPGVCSSPVASDRFYTLNYDEPDSFLRDESGSFGPESGLMAGIAGIIGVGFFLVGIVYGYATGSIRKTGDIP